MFGRIGLYLIPVLLPVALVLALPLAAHASKLETISFNAADFTEALQGGDVVPAVVKAQVLLDRVNILLAKSTANLRRAWMRRLPRSRKSTIFRPIPDGAEDSGTN